MKLSSACLLAQHYTLASISLTSCILLFVFEMGVLYVPGCLELVISTPSSGMLELQVEVTVLSPPLALETLNNIARGRERLFPEQLPNREDESLMVEFQAFPKMT